MPLQGLKLLSLQNSPLQIIPGFISRFLFVHCPSALKNSMLEVTVGSLREREREKRNQRKIEDKRNSPFFLNKIISRYEQEDIMEENSMCRRIEIGIRIGAWTSEF